MDSAGDIYLTGRTQGSAGTAGLDGNTHNGSYDIFLAKYDSAGTKKWTKLLGTSGPDSGGDLVVDSSDNIYISGLTYGDLDGTNAGGGGAL